MSTQADSARGVARGETARATTNDNGEYILASLPGGRYEVAAVKEGIGTGRATAAVRAGSLATANVTLSRSTSVQEEAGCHPSGRPPASTEENPFAAYPANPPLVRLARWLDAVQLHTPGCADPAATDIGTWLQVDLKSVLDDIGRLSIFLQNIRELEKKDPVRWQQNRADAAARRQTRYQAMGQSPADSLPGRYPGGMIKLHDQLFTFDQVEQVFHGNETVERGAVLHADIAALIRDDLTAQNLFVDDGRQRGRSHVSVHWEFGRKLLDSIVPAPGGDNYVLLWYRATSAYLIGNGRLGEAPAHLEYARKVFPDREVFQIDSAYLHEKLSSPAVQGALDELRAAGARVLVDSRKDELERAEQFFRAALALAPEDGNARLRLAHTLGAFGRHTEAVTELQTATQARLTREQQYLAALFLGREEQALGSLADAQRQFQAAAALYPAAQSPWLALSGLARESGDRTGALRALKHVTAAAAPDAFDPWWIYYEPHLQDADVLMNQMRAMLTTTTKGADAQ